MTKTKIALFAIPMCAILIAIGVFSVNFAEKELTPNSETSYAIQNELIPQAYAEKPEFRILDDDQLGLWENEFVDEVECKVKWGDLLRWYI